MKVKVSGCLFLILMFLISTYANGDIDPTPPASTVRLVFIHHSTGEGWLSIGGLRQALNQNGYYVTDTNYGWGPDSIGDNTDIGYWYDWFLGPNRDTYMKALYANNDVTDVIGDNTIPNPGGSNTIVMFKSCFPNGQVSGGNANDPPLPKGENNPIWGSGIDDTYTVSNIKGMYRDLLDYFAAQQDKLFIFITTPPLLQENVEADVASKHRAITLWMVNDWLKDYPYNNVFVFDYYNVLTSNGGDPNKNDLNAVTGNHHRFRNGQIEHVIGFKSNFSAYGEWGDDHPTAAGHQKATGEFLPLLNTAYNRWQSSSTASNHPRLWLTADDLPRLRSWAVDSNPVYRDGLAVLADQAKANMDAGLVPQQDGGSYLWEEYPSEMYAQLFAFMSLISSDQSSRDDYAQRSRTLLMHVINEAVKGPSDGQPFRDPDFSIRERSRWWGEAYALTVDWIYPYLSSTDKSTIRKVFLRWIDENIHAETTSNNHPEPIGVVNNAVLVSDPVLVRWSANNYYTGHARNIGLMAMAFDEADDSGNQLRNYLSNATGAWLYVVDNLLRNDARGGLSPEGFEYAPESTGYLTQLLLALHTAGQDDPTKWGPQVVLSNNPFWNDMITAYLHSLSPTTVTHPWLGQVYQPAWYGDGEKYWLTDFMEVFGPLALYDYSTGNKAGLDALRWIQKYTPPGGSENFMDRIANTDAFRNAVLYFMLFDPNAQEPVDPRLSQSDTLYVPGIGRILARTGWDTDANWFTYTLGWLTIDHQQGEGNKFEFYRHGEWLTKELTGYDINSSDYHNTLALENDLPEHHDPNDFRYTLWQHGSQWLYLPPSSDGQILAHSFTKDYIYVLGDATGLYNSDYENSSDITHASRSIIWLKPDHIVVYDRAISKTDGRFKRFWLNLPENAIVSGNYTSMTTAKGQQLSVNTLLPTNAVINSEPAEYPSNGEPADEEPMKFRLRVEAAGNLKDVRFLHVLQGTDAGVNADSAALVKSTGGTNFDGAIVNETVILFPQDLGIPFTSLSYKIPASTKVHIITGLTHDGGYNVVMQPMENDIQVTITNGSTYNADSGGVLMLRTVVSSLNGDVNNDGKIRADDAILALQISVDLIKPDDYQKSAADMNNDGKVGADDAIIILRKSVDLGAPSKESALAKSQIRVTLRDAHGMSGETITVPLEINNADTVAGGDICIFYNGAVLKAIDVTSDSDMLLVGNVNESGKIRIAFANAGKLNGETLAKIRFKVLRDTTSPLTIESAELYNLNVFPINISKVNAEFSSYAISPECSNLLQNFPNPFNPDTWIPYQLKEGSEVKIQIHNAIGYLVRELKLGYKPSGTYITYDRAAHWDGKNDAGEIVSSGVYFYSIQAGKYSFTRKMIVER